MADQTNPEQKLAQLGIELPRTEYGNRPLVPYRRVGNLIYTSGNTPPAGKDGKPWSGQLGKEYTVEQGYEAARLVGISLLGVLKLAIGDLNKVKQVVKVLGMVNCVPGWSQQPQVMHGFSDLMVEVFGDRGRHARSAVGMAGLPGNVPVEIEFIVEVED